MRKYLILQTLIISFIILSTSVILSAEDEKDRLLVIPLKAQKGIDQEEAILLTDILSVEIYRSGRFTILNREDMKAVLSEKEFELTMGCEDNVCLLENVAKLAVNKIITGNIGKLGTKYIVSIRMINEDGENEVMEKETCDCAISDLDKTIEQVAYKFLKYLDGDVVQEGSISVESIPRGAEIYLDGDNRGTTPDSIRRIVPGTYEIEIKKYGYKGWSERIDVEEGEETQIYAKLEKVKPLVRHTESNTPIVDRILRDAKEKDERRLAETKAEWSEWQDNMTSAYNEALRRDKDAHLRIREKARSWQHIIGSFRQDNPYSTEDNRIRRHAKIRLEEFRRLAGKPGRPGRPGRRPEPPNDKRKFKPRLDRPKIRDSLKLRSFYRNNLSVDQVQSIPHFTIRGRESWGFCGHSTIKHNYEVKTINGNKVVTDYATGLMWIQSGSKEVMTWKKASQRLQKLNHRGYAGYHDWRLPTVEELASLIEPAKKNGGLYISPFFDRKQEWIWTGDKWYDSNKLWDVNFGHGSVNWNPLNDQGFVRPVRSMSNMDSQHIKDNEEGMIKLSDTVFTNNGSNVFHKRNCSKLDTKDDLVEFGSPQEASKAGGLPCNYCWDADKLR